jgi:hypothetical protein
LVKDLIYLFADFTIDDLIKAQKSAKPKKAAAKTKAKPKV